MNNVTLKHLVDNECLDLSRFARYTYRAIEYVSRKTGNGVFYSQIYSEVKKRFQEREKKQDPPYFGFYSSVKITRFLVNGLTLLEQRGLIALDEETGRYSIKRPDTR